MTNDPASDVATTELTEAVDRLVRIAHLEGHDDFGRLMRAPITEFLIAARMVSPRELLTLPREVAIDMATVFQAIATSGRTLMCSLPDNQAEKLSQLARSYEDHLEDIAIDESASQDFEDVLDDYKFEMLKLLPDHRQEGLSEGAVDRVSRICYMRCDAVEATSFLQHLAEGQCFPNVVVRAVVYGKAIEAPTIDEALSEAFRYWWDVVHPEDAGESDSQALDHA
jgi:hypothetical protein